VRANGQLPDKLVSTLILTLKAFTLTFFYNVESVSHLTFFEHKLIFCELLNLEAINQAEFLVLIDVFK
jgi:hypothetical protein